MTIMKEVYVDLQEKYEKAMKLAKEVEAEPTPYLSKYLANQELTTMKASIEDLLRKQTRDSKEYFKLTGMLGSVYYHLGSIAIDVDETSNGQKYLTKCKEVIEDLQLKPEIVQVTQLLYNQLAIMSAEYDPSQSMTYIMEAKKTYEQFKQTDESPIDVSDLFIANIEAYDVDKARANFEKNYTLTLYYLAQIYGALKDAVRSSIYCHITLQRQLESKDYDPIDWALNAATLSQFFMERNGFKQARHHLAASSHILEKYEQELSDVVEHSDEQDAKVETFKHRSADVARCWAKYGLLLLSTSRERLMNHTDDIDKNCSTTTDLMQLEHEIDSDLRDLTDLTFPMLDLTSYESQISDQFVLTVQDARKVFTNVQNWLNKAHEYYTLNNLASDYIEIAQDKSQAYARLAFFEDSPENQAKLHKRRADLLEDVVNNINPACYTQYCRQIWFELAQTYTEILDIKIDKLQESKERPTAHALSKINSLVHKSIEHYTNFVNNFKTRITDEMPQTICEDLEKPFLQAYFHIGALYSRCIVLDKDVKLQNDVASLEAYKKVTDYCDANPKAQELIPQELPICRQMVELLPLRIAKVKQEL